MRKISLTIIFFFTISLLSGCAENNYSSRHTGTTPPPPAEEILINNEQFNKPYKILGPVQYTLRSRPSLFSNQLDLREQAIDLLKQQTYAKYGDEVDAIIDTRVEEITDVDAQGKLSVTHIEGVAISFLPGNATVDKPPAKGMVKRKFKSAKKILVFKKTKPARKVADRTVEKPVKKAKEEDIQISPSEMLK